MSRGKPAPALPISERQYKLLSKYGGKHTISQNTKTRLTIVLLASQGHTNAFVKNKLGVSINTVKKWRRRWEADYESLQSFELGESGKGVSDKDLLARMLSVLKDNPRSGAPKRITLAQEQQIIALACEKPEDYGVIMTQWTREMLAQVVITKGIVETISPSYVGEILKKEQAPTS